MTLDTKVLPRYQLSNEFSYLLRLVFVTGPPGHQNGRPPAPFLVPPR